MVSHDIKRLSHDKENLKLSEEAAYRMREKIHQIHFWQEINAQNARRDQDDIKKKTTQLKWAQKKRILRKKMQMADEHLSKCLQ